MYMLYVNKLITPREMKREKERFEYLCWKLIWDGMGKAKSKSESTSEHIYHVV